MRSVLVLAALAAVLVASGSASADPVLAKLSQQDRAALTARVTEARRASPDAFAAVARVRTQMTTLDARKRGRLASAGRALEALGRDALFPMLAAIADGTDRGDLSEAAWTSYRAGLFEAVGRLRDSRAFPVLAAAVEAPAVDRDVLRASSAALGRLGTDDAATRLVRAALAAPAKSIRRAAIVSGMGTCHRAAVADALARIADLASRPGADADEATLVAAVDALGMVGSSWAWKTPEVAAAGAAEEARVRATATRALETVYGRSTGEIRMSAEAGLAMVTDARTGGVSGTKN